MLGRNALQLGSQLDRAITEKGVLQLLFDLRFLRNTLAGGRPPQPDQAAATAGGRASVGAALSQRKRAFTELESSLQVLSVPLKQCCFWRESQSISLSGTFRSSLALLN